MSERGCLKDIVLDNISGNKLTVDTIVTNPNSLNIETVDYNNPNENATITNITSSSKVIVNTELETNYIKKNINIDDYNNIVSTLQLVPITTTLITEWDIFSANSPIDLNTNIFIFNLTIDITSKKYKILKIIDFKNFITNKDSNNNPLAIVKCGITERFTGNNSETFSVVSTVIVSGMFVGNDYILTIYNPDNLDLEKETIGFYIDITNSISS
jgi:hypothetical protein